MHKMLRTIQRFLTLVGYIIRGQTILLVYVTLILLWGRAPKIYMNILILSRFSMNWACFRSIPLHHRFTLN